MRVEENASKSALAIPPIYVAPLHRPAHHPSTEIVHCCRSGQRELPVAGSNGRVADGT